jgi:electron transfer flavoprotein alpha subunit
VDAAEDPDVSQFKGEEIAQSDRHEQASTRIIISGGRSLGSSENPTTYIEPIGDQLGQSGKVRPSSPSRLGSRGHQHLAVMKDSKVSGAINKDEEAPIFQVAADSLLGDLFQILRRFQERLTKAGPLGSHIVHVKQERRLLARSGSRPDFRNAAMSGPS